MIKQTKRMAVLALASAALLTPVARGATVGADLNHLILGFYADANPGQTLNLEVDLGLMSQFYGGTPGQVIPLPGLTAADLAATYGANWASRTDLHWGAVATTGRFATSPDGLKPIATLWATAPNCANAWNRGGLTAQKAASANMEPMMGPGSPGTLAGATSTANSSSAAVIDATQSGSWSKQDGKVGGTSFGYFNPTIDNYEGTNIVASQLYEMQPGTGKGTYVGDLVMTDQGLSFRVASPTAAVCTNITVQAGTNCQASVTADDVDGGSTGYCLSLAIDNGGPFGIGSHPVVLTVTDGVGVSNSCTATVTVEGAAPVVSSTANISQCNPVATFATPTATGCNTPIGAVVCTPASGSTFPLGTTTVICTATDNAGLIGSNSFTVTIAGAVPSITCPANIVTNVVNASDTNMVINFTVPTASGCATPINVVASPVSGSLFPVGTTTVHLTATDALGQVGTCSFTVNVQGAGISGISGQVNALTDPKLTTGRKASLVGSLTRAQADINKNKKNSVVQACGQLKGFLIKVSVYAKLGIITPAEAAQLTAAAKAEQAALGCK